MKNIFLFIVCVIFGTSCSRSLQEYKKEGSVSIDMENLKELSFYDVFTKMDIYPLETINESLIKNTYKVVLHGGLFYILDDMLSVIFVFNQEGNMSGLLTNMVMDRENMPE